MAGQWLQTATKRMASGTRFTLSIFKVWVEKEKYCARLLNIA